MWYVKYISIKLKKTCESPHSRSSLLSSLFFFYFSKSCFIKTSTPDMKFLLNFLLVLAFTSMLDIFFSCFKLCSQLCLITGTCFIKVFGSKALDSNSSSLFTNLVQCQLWAPIFSLRKRKSNDHMIAYGILSINHTQSW